MTVLGGKQFLKQGYPEAIVKPVFFCFSLLVCFFKIFINIDRGKRQRGGGHLPQNCPNTFGQDCSFVREASHFRIFGEIVNYE